MLAIAGAGPMLGMSLARAFGGQGYKVALIARREEALTAMAEELRGEGIEAAGFVADLVDEAAVADAFARATARFGPVDVLEFSPLAMRFVPPSDTTPALVREAIDLMVGGAINATRQVLPAMQARGAGALLYTSGRSSLLPMKLLGSLGPAAAALRHYVYSLHDELASQGIFVGTIPILARLDRTVADEVAAAYLSMIADRTQIERVVGEGDAAEVGRQIAALTQNAPPLVLPGS
ncbi:MAG: SDR family NAD(P)-dependent oxidoreductase [Sphingobium sp.]|nr:SDR family NAD(P)-dependent oxidoreductase [Sphingobium sp.]